MSRQEPGTPELKKNRRLRNLRLQLLAFYAFQTAYPLFTIMTRPDSAANWRIMVSFAIVSIVTLEGFYKRWYKELEQQCLTLKARLAHWLVYLIPAALLIHFVIRPERETQLLVAGLSFVCLLDTGCTCIKEIRALKGREASFKQAITTLKPYALLSILWATFIVWLVNSGH